MTIASALKIPQKNEHYKLWIIADDYNSYSTIIIIVLQICKCLLFIINNLRIYKFDSIYINLIPVTMVTIIKYLTFKLLNFTFNSPLLTIANALKSPRKNEYHKTWILADDYK